MKKLFLLGSFVVLAACSTIPKDVQPESTQTQTTQQSSTPASSTTKLNPTRRVGNKTIGSIELRDGWFDFKDINVEPSDNMKAWAKDANNVLTLAKLDMSMYKNDSEYAEIIKQYGLGIVASAAFSKNYEPMVEDPSTIQKNTVDVSTLPHLKELARVIIPEVKGKYLLIYFFVPKEDPENAYYMSIEGDKAFVEEYQYMISSWKHSAE